MIMIVYSIQRRMEYSEGEYVDIIMRYTSREEANKHISTLYNKKLSDPKYQNISFDNSKYVLRYRDMLFKYGNTCTCEIIEEEIKIKDKFDPMDV